ncbi:MAG: GntR family transcriptional regulator [Alphaproteobacteria bacterium]|nr:GntR family transcriptional regulator [Alphaproteobacteria bacterium]
MSDRPLYRMVAEQIEARIVESGSGPGTLLPTESVLEQEYNVSRITIRQALGLLKRRGLLGSRSGLGTFVRPGAKDQPGMRFTGSLSEIVYYAAATRYTPARRELVVPPADVAEYLKTPKGEKAYCFSGRRGWPGHADFCLEQIYVPQRFGEHLDNSRLNGSPLFVQLEKRNQVKITEVEQVITAVTAGADLARKLKIQPRAAVLKAIRVYRLLDRRVAEISVTHYVPAKFSYMMNLFLE